MCVIVVVAVVEIILCFILKVGTFTSPVLVLDVGSYITLEHYLSCVCVCVCVCARARARAVVCMCMCVCVRAGVWMWVGVLLWWCGWVYTSNYAR